MKITFVSNYINHHQIPFSDELYSILGEDYHFIQTEPMEEERVKMGWALDITKIPYVISLDKEEQRCHDLILRSDVVVFGGTEKEELIRPRLEAGKVTVRNSERLYREGQWKAVSPRGLRKKYQDHTKYRKGPNYLFSIGAYTASDFSIIQAYPGKKYKWGYFPSTREYDWNELKQKKIHLDPNGNEVLHILWAGRFMPLKHPEYAIKMADQLRKEGYSFHLDMVGGGEMDQQLREEVAHLGLKEMVTFHGFLSPQEVRDKMEQSNIFLFTSNYLEGWGAVVNESMNSGCALVIGHGVGSAGYLVKDGINGLIYKNECYSKFYIKVKSLFNKDNNVYELGLEAYRTIAQEWNEKNAARLFLAKCEEWMAGKQSFEKEGPLSKAKCIFPVLMYSYMKYQKKQEMKRKKRKI